MTERPCPRVRTGPGYANLRKSTKAALARLYKGLGADGGCWRFVVAWTSPRTHAQNAHVLVGYRPLGLAPFDETPTLADYIVPAVHKVAKAAGLCGPVTGDPVHFQTPYRAGKERKPSCHLRA